MSIVTYVLKSKLLGGQSLESYVSGTKRMNFLKRPIIEQDEEDTPIM
jgi:hypothetical protein